MIGEVGTRSPDFTEPLVGFRSFRLQSASDGDVSRLISPHVKVPWHEARMVAECRKPGTDHEAPHAYCGCGVYAYYDAGRVLTHANCVLTLAGIVTLTGRVEAHRHGMRGQRAHLHALGYGPDWPRRQAWQMALDIAAGLGTPLVPVEMLQAVAGEFGRPLAPEQRPFYEPPSPRAGRR